MSQDTMYTALERLYAFGLGGIIFTGGGERFYNR